jgi:hypothetical protein
MIFGAVVAALTLGFSAGLFAFRVKSRWCPACGTMTNVERPRLTSTTADQDGL